jgi:HlyD family secretion protein
VRQAEEGHDRALALHKKGVATQAQLDNVVNARDSAKARLVSAQKALAASQAQIGVIDAQKQNVLLQISKTELRAPADGLVLARNATLGGVVSAAGGPLFRIAIGSEFELAADVAETSLPRLAPGMLAEVSLAGAQNEIGGSIRRISPEINQASRLGSIRISLDDDAEARGGNFARGDIELVRREGVAVPTSAVIYKGADAFLQLVENGKVKTVPVKLGARAGGFVEVVNGLAAGGEVVSRAGTFVADGVVITPVRGAQTGAIKP